MPPALSAAVGLLALLLAVAALALATLANRRWAQRPRSRAAGAEPELPAREDPVLAALRDRVDALDGAVADLREDVAGARGDADLVRTALRHVAVVRYDAFADVGGRLSYSVALLDDTASGLVLTTLAGKSDVRTYVRTVSAGSGDGTLTAEEQQAIEAAAAGAPGSQP